LNDHNQLKEKFHSKFNFRANFDGGSLMEERNMNFRDSLTLNESEHNFNQSQGENVYDQYFMDFIEREIPKEP